jgi:hypothetical protein
MLVFPFWVSRGKISVKCVYFPLYLLCSCIETFFAINNCKRLKSTEGQDPMTSKQRSKHHIFVNKRNMVTCHSLPLFFLKINIIGLFFHPTFFLIWK